MMFVFEKKTQKQTCYFVISDIQFPLRHNHLGAPPWIMPGGFRALGKLLRQSVAVRAGAEAG